MSDVNNKYKGLKENLERFKNDLTDEKTRLLFSIAYKQGYDQALSTANTVERNKHLFDFLDYWKIKMGGSFTTDVLEKSIKQYLEGK